MLTKRRYWKQEQKQKWSFPRQSGHLTWAGKRCTTGKDYVSKRRWCDLVGKVRRWLLLIGSTFTSNVRQILHCHSPITVLASSAGTRSPAANSRKESSCRGKCVTCCSLHHQKKQRRTAACLPAAVTAHLYSPTTSCLSMWIIPWLPGSQALWGELIRIITRA